MNKVAKKLVDKIVIIVATAFFLITANQVDVVQAFNNYDIPDNVHSLASAITVMLKDSSSDNSEFFDSGSGIILYKDNSEYFILTSAHNLDSNKDSKIDINDKIINDYVIQTNDNEKHYVSDFFIVSNKDLGDLDLAILIFASPENYDVLANKYDNSRKIRLGEDIYVAGFPETMKGELAIHKGKFLSQHSPDPDDKLTSTKFPENYTNLRPPQSFTGGYSLKYRPDTDKGMAPGMSGGPILTSDGYLIGIHGRENFRGDKRGIGIDVYLNSYKYKLTF